MVRTAAILSGGLATRLRPLTETVPKCLVDVAGKPFIDRQLSLLQSKGIDHVILCLGHMGQQVEQIVGTGERWNLRVDYSYDGPELLGTAGALQQARPYLADVFWVLYGDSYLDFDYAAVSDHFEHRGAGKLGLMTVFANQNRWDKSNVVFKNGQILKYDKTKQSPEMLHIDYGATLLRAGALDLIPHMPYDLADLYSRMVEAGLILGYEIRQRFYEVGSYEGIADADRYFAELDVAVADKNAIS
jgi:N-acetyl-alpha-D-muramate 1-phosphate uridylyltransferase